VIICLNEIKMGVLAKALVNPGSNTLLMNLLSSFSDVSEVRIKDNDESLKPAWIE
jgi:hypothetical protein